jgi:hypothetical protein
VLFASVGTGESGLKGDSMSATVVNFQERSVALNSLIDKFQEYLADYRDCQVKEIRKVLEDVGCLQLDLEGARKRIRRLEIDNSAIMNENYILREKLVFYEHAASDGIMANQKAALEAWQEWWSKVMRPFVVRLTDAISPIHEGVNRLLEPLRQNCPSLHEFPVAILQDGKPHGKKT